MKSKTNIVLVHGAWADGSSWGKVDSLSSAERIQRDCRTDTFDFFGR